MKVYIVMNTSDPYEIEGMIEAVFLSKEAAINSLGKYWSTKYTTVIQEHELEEVS